MPPIPATDGDDLDEVAGLSTGPGGQLVLQMRHIPLYRGSWVHEDNFADGAMPSPQHSLQGRNKCSWGTDGEGQLEHDSVHHEHYEYEQNGDDSDYEHEGEEI